MSLIKKVSLGRWQSHYFDSVAITLEEVQKCMSLIEALDMSRCHDSFNAIERLTLCIYASHVIPLSKIRQTLQLPNGS